MTVKIIPITPEYREGWEQTFRHRNATGLASMLTNEEKKALAVSVKVWESMTMEERRAKATAVLDKWNGCNV